MTRRAAILMSVVMLAATAAVHAAEQPQSFPLAAPAGTDSNARQSAPAGAVNQGPFDPSTWKYGSAFPAGSPGKLWNPAKIKLMQGGKLVGGTVWGVSD